MKKVNKIIIFLCILWILGFILLIIPDNTANTDMDEIMTSMSVQETDDKVGADIWLKQAIHGTDGIHYRYVIKTDCPKWDFETRYMTDKPIEWIDETSAVEVIIHDVQIRYEGTVYASGQYYTVPLLGGISSETVSYDEWKENLIKQAYNTYVSDKDSKFDGIIRKIVYGLSIIIGIYMFYYINKKDNNKETETEKEKDKETE